MGNGTASAEVAESDWKKIQVVPCASVLVPRTGRPSTREQPGMPPCARNAKILITRAERVTQVQRAALTRSRPPGWRLQQAGMPCSFGSVWEMLPLGRQKGGTGEKDCQACRESTLSNQICTTHTTVHTSPLKNVCVLCSNATAVFKT